MRRRIRTLWRGSAGIFDSKSTILLLLGVAALYVGTRYAAPYIDKYEVEKAIQSVISNTRQAASNEQLVSSLMRQLRSAGLRDFEPEDFVVSRKGRRVRITADYEVFVDLGLGKGHTLAFHVSEQAFLR